MNPLSAFRHQLRTVRAGPKGSRARASARTTTLEALVTPSPLDALAEAFLRTDIREVRDEDLLGVLLAGTTRTDPTEEARAHLTRVNGNLAQILEGASFVSDVYPMGRARILAAAELVRRGQIRGVLEGVGPAILGPSDARRIARTYAHGAKERVVAIYLNAKLAFVGARTLSVGNRNASIVDPIEVFREALLLRADALLLVHNHPSGDASPSQADDKVTQEIGTVGRLLRIRLIDHLILGRNESTYSYAENGRL